MRGYRSDYRVRNWGPRLGRLTPAAFQRETLRWEHAVRAPSLWRDQQLIVVAQATGRSTGDVLKAWGILSATERLAAIGVRL